MTANTDSATATSAFATPTGGARSDAGVADLAADFATLRAMSEDSDTFAGPPDDQRRIDYLPTPAEIFNACASIRQNWSRSEKRRRFVGALIPDDEDRNWQPPVIDTTHFRITATRAGSDSSR